MADQTSRIVAERERSELRELHLFSKLTIRTLAYKSPHNYFYCSGVLQAPAHSLAMVHGDVKHGGTEGDIASAGPLGIPA